MSFLGNHRGPFQLVLTRPGKGAGFHTTEWLRTESDVDEVESEARAFLADPRDTITSVDVWSDSEQLFVGGYRRD